MRSIQLLLVLGSAVQLLPIPLGAQDSAYIVLSPIQQGPAAVMVDGRSRGTLSNSEVTIAVLPGPHTLLVQREGFAAFVRPIVIAAGDVQQLEVKLEPVRAEIVEDKPQQGTARQGVGRFRVIHLEPAKTSIKIGGILLGDTPATISVPSGEHEVEIGAYTTCWIIVPGDSGYIRVRSGVLEQTTGITRCDRRPIPVTVYGLPDAVNATLNDDPVRLRRMAPGIGSTTLARPGTYILALGGQYVPLELELDVHWGDSVVAVVDMGSLPPPPRGDTLSPPRPEPRDGIQSYPYPYSPVAPDSSTIPRMERTLAQCRRQAAAASRAGTPTNSCSHLELPIRAMRDSMANFGRTIAAYREQVHTIDSINAAIKSRATALSAADAARLAQWQVSDSLARAARADNAGLMDRWRTGVRANRKPSIVRVVRRPMS